MIYFFYLWKLNISIAVPKYSESFLKLHLYFLNDATSVVSGWTTRRHLQGCPEATLMAVCYWGLCDAEKLFVTLDPLWGQECSGAAFLVGFLNVYHFPQFDLACQLLPLKLIKHDFSNRISTTEEHIYKNRVEFMNSKSFVCEPTSSLPYVLRSSCLSLAKISTLLHSCNWKGCFFQHTAEIKSEGKGTKSIH